MPPIIKVENLSKQYRLGTVGTGTMRDDLKRWWYRTRGKEDPFLTIGESNDRSKKGESDYVWALKDINFEVQAGEVLGIIGRNGAGKSTLLKILSRVTEPTTGSITMHGRVASLLEVGTGFHPDLTGRENIYLNGAILGMTKKEIARKFDEIVDFAGVERYIDTPVKRYSSGMHVRLGFAVAAHLEPEILIVDEVLAVGDAEFQKKCLGKMKDVSVNEGRTVLFVSHNMGAIQELCETSLLLEQGTSVLIGETDAVLQKYLAGHNKNKQYYNDRNSQKIHVKSASIEPNKTQSNSWRIILSIWSNLAVSVSVDLRIKDALGSAVGFASVGGLNFCDKIKLQSGNNDTVIALNTGTLALGEYGISIDITNPNIDYYERLNDCLWFEVVKTFEGDRQLLQSWNYGCIQMEATTTTVETKL